jgi:hypothetical protein
MRSHRHLFGPPLKLAHHLQRKPPPAAARSLQPQRPEAGHETSPVIAIAVILPPLPPPVARLTVYRSRCRSLSKAKNCSADCRTRPCRSPQKLSVNPSTKCWKCSLIGVTFAPGCKSPFQRTSFSCFGQNQLTPSRLLHNRGYATPEWESRAAHHPLSRSSSVCL